MFVLLKSADRSLFAAETTDTCIPVFPNRNFDLPAGTGCWSVITRRAVILLLRASLSRMRGLITATELVYSQQMKIETFPLRRFSSCRLKAGFCARIRLWRSRRGAAAPPAVWSVNRPEVDRTAAGEQPWLFGSLYSLCGVIKHSAGAEKLLELFLLDKNV